MHKEDVEKCLIYKVIHGSHAYGLSTPESDVDLRGICIPSKEYFLTHHKRFEQFEDKENDTTIFNLQKFIALAADSNPNIIELLFITPDKILYAHDSMKELLEHRHLFVTAKAKFTFSGFAYGQLQRIKTHRRWLLNPPDHKPTRTEFDLHETKTINASELGAFNKMLEDGYVLDSSALEFVRRENAFQGALKNWNQYQDWKKNRNPKRAAFEAKYGYDVKHASHLVRLLRMGYEILTEGKVIVFRPDREEILAIKQGAWPYEKLIVYAEEMDAMLTEVYEKGQYVVPHHPDHDTIGRLCMNILEGYWKQQNHYNYGH